MTVAAPCRASMFPASVVRFSGVAPPVGVARASQSTSRRQNMDLSDDYRCIRQSWLAGAEGSGVGCYGAETRRKVSSLTFSLRRVCCGLLTNRTAMRFWSWVSTFLIALACTWSIWVKTQKNMLTCRSRSPKCLAVCVATKPQLSSLRGMSSMKPPAVVGDDAVRLSPEKLRVGPDRVSGSTN